MSSSGFRLHPYSLYFERHVQDVIIYELSVHKSGRFTRSFTPLEKLKSSKTFLEELYKQRFNSVYCQVILWKVFVIIYTIRCGHVSCTK
jgi:hypothetical protein